MDIQFRNNNLGNKIHIQLIKIIITFYVTTITIISNYRNIKRPMIQNCRNGLVVR